jgi:hypothetical protein
MELQKCGVKLFLNMNESYSSKDFIPVFHSWIQDKVVDDHLMIDVADYSHIPSWAISILPGLSCLCE